MSIFGKNPFRGLFAKKPIRSVPKLVMEKLPLEENDILLIGIPDELNEKERKRLTEKFQDIQERLPYRNAFLITPRSMLVQVLHPIRGRFQITSQKITVFTEDNL